MDNSWLDLLQNANQLSKVIETNQYTGQFGLTLSQEDALLILENRKISLREQKRVEFGEGIVPKIIHEFCDSEYIDQSNYVDTVIRLQEIFYLYKNEMNDEITDDELIHLMKEQYELLCFGDLDYLESTCLSDFAQAIRAGYQGFKETDGYGEYSKFDRQERWSYELYLETLKELFRR
ncbi:MAG: DUF6323 family protein [Butyrivibrio sp.]